MNKGNGASKKCLISDFDHAHMPSVRGVLPAEVKHDVKSAFLILQTMLCGEAHDGSPHSDEAHLDHLTNRAREMIHGFDLHPAKDVSEFLKIRWVTLPSIAPDPETLHSRNPRFRVPAVPPPLPPMSSPASPASPAKKPLTVAARATPRKGGSPSSRGSPKNPPVSPKRAAEEEAEAGGSRTRKRSIGSWFKTWSPDQDDDEEQPPPPAADDQGGQGQGQGSDGNCNIQ